MKNLISNLQSGHNKTQLIVLGILSIIAVIIIAYMNHTGVIHFDKY